MRELLTEHLLIISVVVFGVGLVAVYAVAKGRGFTFRLKKGDGSVEVGVKEAQSTSPGSGGDIHDVTFGKDASMERAKAVYKVGHEGKPNVPLSGNIEKINAGDHAKVKDSSVVYHVGHTVKDEPEEKEK